MPLSRLATASLLGVLVLAGCSGSVEPVHNTPGWSDLISGVQSDLHALQPSTGTTPTPAPTTGPVSPPITSSPNAVATDLTALEVGQCILWPYDASYSLIDVVQVVPCSETHYGEVYVVGTLPEGNYPPDPNTTVAHLCEDAFAAYVGVDYWSSIYYYDGSFPSQAEWDSGARGWRCYVTETDNESIGSVRGSNQ